MLYDYSEVKFIIYDKKILIQGGLNFCYIQSNKNKHALYNFSKKMLLQLFKGGTTLIKFVNLSLPIKRKTDVFNKY